MHSMLVVGPDMTLMAADVPARHGRSARTARSRSPATTRTSCAAGGTSSVADGTVGVPLEKAPWGDSFGMCTDRFGVAWMVNIAGAGS